MFQRRCILACSVLCCVTVLAATAASAVPVTMASLRDDLSSRLAGTRSYSFAGRSVVELLGVPVTTKITMDYRRDGAMRIHFPSPLLSIEYRSDGERTMIAVPTRGVYTVTESLADTVGFSGDLLHDIPAYTGLVDLLLPPPGAGTFPRGRSRHHPGRWRTPGLHGPAAGAGHRRLLPRGYDPGRRGADLARRRGDPLALAGGGHLARRPLSRRFPRHHRHVLCGKACVRSRVA